MPEPGTYNPIDCKSGVYLLSTNKTNGIPVFKVKTKPRNLRGSLTVQKKDIPGPGTY